MRIENMHPRTRKMLVIGFAFLAGWYAHKAHGETVIAKAVDSYGTVTLLTDTDTDDGICKGRPMVIGYGPEENADQAVYGCWEPNADRSVHVKYLLPEGVVWEDDYSHDDFKLTPYGKHILHRELGKIGDRV